MSETTKPSTAFSHIITAMTNAWNQFWFTARMPHTLCVLRIITGMMLLYSHLVLASELPNFLGEHAWINNSTAQQLHDGSLGIPDWGRSYLWHIDSPAILWAHHGLTLLVTLAFTVGFLTRVTAPTAWFLQLMYIHRLTGAHFGFDQIVTYTAMYLMLTPCGAAFSVDAWLRKRFKDGTTEGKLWHRLLSELRPSISANIGTRLLQLHLCTIYLFGGLAKARGLSWWDGTAVWYSVANYEYQSWDMTWLAYYPRVFSAMSNLTMFWEIFFCVLIWHKSTRWLALALAVAVHGGIALFLGMATFGLMMLAANMVFIEPHWLHPLLRRWWPDSAAARALLPAAGSTIATAGTEVSKREAKLKAASARLSAKNAKLKRRYKKIKQREQQYRDRVARLKKREAKIKAFIEKRRRERDAKKEAQTDDSSSS